MQAAEKLGIKFHDFTEKQLCLVTNMMYSDYCEVAKKINANNMDFFAEMAKAFLKDKDAGAQDKLAAYYEYVVKG